MQRRRLLLAAPAAALSACAAPRWPAGRDLAELDATAQAERVRRREVSAQALLDAALDRIAESNPRLNAIVTLLPDAAGEQARAQAAQPVAGPFTGVPYALKDLIDWQGTRRTSGSRLLAGHVSAQSHELVTRTQASGLVLLGKTNTPEFALDGSTEPLLFGPSRNPWDPSRSCGGSSGGAAVAVASGMLPMAHASDGGGSIRIPASCCGLFGLKPSRGRMVGSRDSDAGVEHALTRSVRDSAALFLWNQRQDAAAPLPPVALPAGPLRRRLRIGYAMQGLRGRGPSAAVQAALDDTARLCEALGHHVEPVALPVDGETFLRHFMTLWSGGAARAVELARSRGLDPEAVLEPWTLYLARHAAGLPAEARSQATAYAALATRQVDEFFTRHDLLLSPVVSEEPPPLGVLAPTVDGPVLWERLLDYVAWTPIHNLAGTPAMSVPLGTGRSGLPIGSQFAARIGQEALLFELALQLEQARPWRGLAPRPAAHGTGT